MAEEKRLVVVGYGMGEHHARLISETDGLVLFGVWDLDAAKRGKAQQDHKGCAAYTSYEQVLNHDLVDGIVIVTPHNTHAEMAIRAMDAGKHVITDKAMCLTVEDAEAMIAARDRNKVQLSVFHNRRWDSDFLTVQHILVEGILGRIQHIQSCVTSWGTFDGWRADKARMGGWLFDWGAHTIDQILLLVKARPTHVYAFAHPRFDSTSDVEAYVNCTITFEGGATATTVIGYLNRIEMPRWYVMGERGTLQADGFQTPFRIRGSWRGVEGELTVPLLKGDWHSFYQNIAEAFAGRTELAVKPEQLVPQIAIAQAAYRSIESKQVISL